MARRASPSEGVVPPVPAGDIDGPAELSRVNAEFAVFQLRMLALQETVRDLVSGEDIDIVLARIVGRGAAAVGAKRSLLVLRRDNDPPTVHHTGFTDEQAHSLVCAVIDQADDETVDSRLVVDVRSGLQSYGRLAVFAEHRMTFLPGDRELLKAYAELVAAALDSSMAVEEAKRQQATSQALLDLGRGLARMTTAGEAGQRLAEAVPATIECDMASVFLYDATDRAMRGVGFSGYSDELTAMLAAMVITENDTPQLRHIVESQRPQFFDTDTEDPFIRGMLLQLDARSAVIVPITDGRRCYGVVAASCRSAVLGSDADMLERLAGIADQGMLVFQNVELIEAARHQALHDPLTDMPNQRLLEDRVELALKQARRNGTKVAMLVVDLDRFKKVNDTLGHVAGDLVIQQVAIRLQSAVRDVDTVSRLGGDEFVILLPGMVTTVEAGLVADRVFVALEPPIRLDQHDLHVSASIGIAMTPADGDTFASLLKAADTAMYEAKAAGRRTVRTYARSMPNRSIDTLALEAELYGAAERGELRALFQPLVDLTTLEVVHAEALVRWEHPRLGMLPPDLFIPIAEETGLISVIDNWMLQSVCQQMADWEADGIVDLGVAVNVCERDLRDPAYADRVASALESSGIAPHRLELEITERIAESAGPGMDQALARLSQLGVRLAIDDFGTGNSAFNRLISGRIDTLKIDRSFLAEVRGDDPRAPLVTALISLGQSLGIRVTAEGVETAVQGDFVRRHGCQLAQGYYFSRPLERKAFETLVKRSLAGTLGLTLDPIITSLSSAG